MSTRKRKHCSEGWKQHYSRVYFDTSLVLATFVKWGNYMVAEINSANNSLTHLNFYELSELRSHVSMAYDCCVSHLILSL